MAKLLTGIGTPAGPESCVEFGEEVGAEVPFNESVTTRAPGASEAGMAGKLSKGYLEEGTGSRCGMGTGRANRKSHGSIRGSKETNRNGRAGRDGGRYRIRTYDFHRVKVALYR